MKKLFFCLRLPFRPILGDGKHLDQEGIRIPPAPIYGEGKFNEELIGILKQHPLCPDQFESWVRSSVNLLVDRVHWLESQVKHQCIVIDDKFIDQFHKLSEEKARAALNDFSMGEAKSEIRLNGGKTKLCVHLKSDEKGIIFDFAGTTAYDYFNLTDSATFGACFGALFSVLDQVVPVNHGAFQTISVSTPKDSMLNAAYPKPVFMGLSDGPGLIASQVLKLIGQIDQRVKMAQSGISQCSIELIFSDGSRYFDHIQMGLAASDRKEGQSGLDPWKRSHLNPSIESAEARFPIRILSHNYRSKSGGSGRWKGGDGITRKIEVLEDATLHWRVFDEFKKNDGLDGGKTGKGPEIYIEVGTKPALLQSIGSQKISAGTKVIISSAGGGGVGELVEDDNS